jgi:hypothetical protein
MISKIAIRSSSKILKYINLTLQQITFQVHTIILEVVFLPLHPPLHAVAAAPGTRQLKHEMLLVIFLPLHPPCMLLPPPLVLGN